MNARFPELDDLRVTVDEAVRERHWAAISDAIAEAPTEPNRVPLRRRLTLWAAAVFTVGLPVAAVAAEHSVPGDLLYPVKLAVEPIRSLFDGDVAAVHRVEELEQVIEEDAPDREIDRALDRADRAVEEADSPELTDRVHRARDLITDRRSDADPHTDIAPTGQDQRDGIDDVHPTVVATTTTIVDAGTGPDGSDHTDVETTTTGTHDQATSNTTAPRDSDRSRDGG
jgi:hypothetical protein